MTGYVGEGLIECHDCGAMVPSIESLIDLPGAPEHTTSSFRPVMDATMHNPGCNYCHSPETMEYLQRLLEPLEQQDQARNKLTVGELFDSIDGSLNFNITAEQLMAVAEVGKLLFYAAICKADDEDNAEFFVEAYSYWGPVVDAVLEECDLGYRNTITGRRFGAAE